MTPGSPPHTRGKGGRTFTAGRDHGITPAHAGKRTMAIYMPNEMKDHPRTRGEKCLSPRRWPRIRGSPPHTRGKGQCLHFHIILLGITPAHAGKSSLVMVTPPPVRDHPRTRGEKRPIAEAHFVCLGSPPHTRGKALGELHCVPHLGITPAHAGKSIPPFVSP